MDKSEATIYQAVYRQGQFIEHLSTLVGTSCTIVSFNGTKLVLETSDGKYIYVYTDLPGEYELEAYVMDKDFSIYEETAKVTCRE